MTTNLDLLLSAQAKLTKAIEQLMQAEGSPKYSYGGKEIRKGVKRDPSELLPWFAARVDKVFRALRADGYDPLLWEALRTQARARKLSKRGTGIANSIHCYRGAVDIVDGSDSTPWTEVPKGFWAAVQKHAEANGLHVLRNRKGRRIDFPHVQCIAQKDQRKFRAATDAQRRIESMWVA